MYGSDTLDDTVSAANDEVATAGAKVIDVQSESEIDLIRAVRAHRFSTAGAIVEPGAPMIAGRSLWDALASLCWLRWRKASSWALALSATGWPSAPFCICSTVAIGHP
ncbi:type II 3-dehydroquinate dehydratase [Micromonospora sp. NPDC020750]|uniref:type II 3-dehydroquinate dehydratase n=1 Tax=unclassified Micromonospora TaxID=2617518 RepID=UPI0037B72348